MSTILGIAGSPRKKQSTDELVAFALESAKQHVPEIKTEFISLAGKKFNGCIACNWCRDNYGCNQSDDLSPVLERLKDDDIKGIIVGSPVYMGSMSSQMKAFLDRTVLFRRKDFQFKHKVAGAIAVGGSRHGGQDLTLMNMHAAFMIHDMIIVPDASPTAHFGGAAWSKIEQGTMHDPVALDTVKNIGINVAEVVKKLYL